MELNSLGITYSLKQTEDYQDLKGRLHRYLIDCIEDDQVNISEWEREALASYAHGRIGRYITEHRLAVNRHDIDHLVGEMIDELTGFGPLQSLLADDSVNDILVNGARNVFVERAGKLEKTGLRFIDDTHVLRVIQRILAPLGRRLDESNPMVDARLPDGSRVNAIIPPLALEGPCVSIRKFRHDPLRATDLLAYGSLSEPMLEFLCNAVAARLNILVSGSTGAGKTTLLNVLSRYIGQDERVVTIEDAAELQLGHSHVVRLETRPPNAEGQGQITARDLVRNALRMRPDRIVLGEIRGVEVMDVLQAMNTGHDGSMSTIHANSARDALMRVEMLVGLAGFQGSQDTLREMVATAVDAVVHISRMSDGKRRINSVTEVTSIQDGQYITHELYSYDSIDREFVNNGMQVHNLKYRELLQRRERGGDKPRV